MTNDLTQKFQAADGFNLAYRHWKATKPKRVVVCIHGIGDYSGWFRNIAPELAKDGSDVYALDLRGFGESVEVEKPKGFVSDFNRHLQDIDDFVAEISGCHRGKKVFILGHSLGGVYSVWYAANHPSIVDGLVLAAPAVACAISDTYSDKKRDPEEIRIMQNDPLETWTLTESYLLNIQCLLLNEVLENACQIWVPTLILQGAADVTVQPEGARQLYTKIAAADKSLEFFGDAGHWFYDALSPAPPRSKCDAAKREKVVSTINDWLSNH